jgi:3-oxoacyl-[acyl-carrier protein] reductase
MMQLSPPPLQDRIAVVTGASSGIGAATARTLAREGATVVIGYHQGRERAQALCEELPGRHHTLQLSLEDGTTHGAAARWLRQHLGRVDLLVNCAGFTERIAHAQIDALEPALFNRILCANVGGTYAVTRALLPLLQASPDAAVVNVSSVSAFTGLGSNMAYCAFSASRPPPWTPVSWADAAARNWRKRPRTRRWAAWSSPPTWRRPSSPAPRICARPRARAS